MKEIKKFKKQSSVISCKLFLYLRKHFRKTYESLIYLPVKHEIYKAFKKSFNGDESLFQEAMDKRANSFWPIDEGFILSDAIDKAVDLALERLLNAGLKYDEDTIITSVWDASFDPTCYRLLLFLEHGANPNIMDHNGHTPLGCATDCCWHGEATKILLSYNADPNQYDYSRKTYPLIAAASKFDREIIEQFISCGADPNVENKPGYMALEAARKTGNKEVIEFLSSL